MTSYAVSFENSESSRIDRSRWHSYRALFCGRQGRFYYNTSPATRVCCCQQVVVHCNHSATLERKELKEQSHEQQNWIGVVMIHKRIRKTRDDE
eukprot:scaffold627_cov125-Cylindrotheca_fusiformis.AAC.13